LAELVTQGKEMAKRQIKLEKRIDCLVAIIESGKTKPTDKVIKTICDFPVHATENEIWTNFETLNSKLASTDEKNTLVTHLI